MLNYIETVPALTPWQTQSASIQAKHIPVFKGLFFGEGGGGGGGGAAVVFVDYASGLHTD